MKGSKSHPAGFALAELLVAISLLGLVFIFALNYMRFTNRQFNFWHKKASNELIYSKVIETLQRDMERGRFYFRNDSILVNLLWGEDSIIYELKNLMLFRNTRKMYRGEISLDSIKVYLLLYHNKSKDKKWVLLDTLKPYLEQIAPSEKEYLYIENYELQIYPGNLKPSPDLSVINPIPISVFQPLKLTDRITFIE